MSNAIEAGKKILRALDKHADLIMKSYVVNNSYIEHDSENSKAIEDLLKNNLVIIDENSALVRLSSPVKLLLDQSLKTTRLKMVNPDIGSAIDGIFFIINQYLQSKNTNSIYDISRLLGELDGNVTELADNLAAQSQNIWRQIDNDFGTVSSLSGKIALNQNTLSKIKNLLKSLDNIDMESLQNLSNRDSELRRHINVKLSGSINYVRQTLNDALQRLNKTLFKLQKLQDQAKTVNRWVVHFQQNPAYQFTDYADKIDVNPLFMRCGNAEILGAVDVNNSSVESALIEIVSDVRKAPIKNEDQPVVLANVSESMVEEEVLELSPFSIAIREVFATCFEQNREIRGIDSFLSMAPYDADVLLWLDALVSEHNAMPAGLKDSFIINFEGVVDPVFNGNFIANDVVICRA